MRLTRWFLILVALSALAIFMVYRRKGEDPEQVPPASKISMSPEETKRLVEQALGKPRETVRFQLDPSSVEPKAAPPLRPPSLAAGSGLELAPSNPSEDLESPEVRVHMASAVQALTAAYSTRRKPGNTLTRPDPSPSSAPAPTAATPSRSTASPTSPAPQ